MTTLTISPAALTAVDLGLRPARESLTRMRATIHLVETQAREGIIRWSEDDGTVNTGTLWRGQRDASGAIIGGGDPRDHLVLVSTRGAHAVGDLLVPFNHLVDLAEVGKCATNIKPTR
jgi:hypothetical protein